MEQTITKALIHTILQHAGDFSWRMQDIGLMSLCLDDRRENVLHVWDPRETNGETPIHNHPFDFISTIIVGEMINTRYEESPGGFEYNRFRYFAPDENARSSDLVRLIKTSATYTEGEQYRQLAHELHDSRQLPGTVTAIRRSLGTCPS